MVRFHPSPADDIVKAPVASAWPGIASNQDICETIGKVNPRFEKSANDFIRISNFLLT